MTEFLPAVAGQRLRAVMSPWEVPASRAAEVAVARVMSPCWVVSSRVPVTASWMVMWPRWVLIAGAGDPQDAVAVLDLDVLGGLGVAVPCGVGGADLDGGVGAVGGDDLDVCGGQVDDGGQGGGGVELLHQVLLRSSLFPMNEKLRCIHDPGNILVALNPYYRRQLRQFHCNRFKDNATSAGRSLQQIEGERYSDPAATFRRPSCP
ncbi:hypothetical protein M2163_008607 [Streptomyces sp. SAI-135]|nr:hypothetical protein [Streptomyces sp. SAI-090]MDH6621499.1 hypothetical protein [Streptomyces sp. SAI-135]